MELNKNLQATNFIGQVIENVDPDHAGRCKIRVEGLFDDLDANLIPWFSPMTATQFSSSAGGGNFSVPKKGAWVRVRFSNGDVYSGEYTSLQKIDTTMFEGTNGLDPDDYEGTHVLLYDQEQELLVAFQPSTGITLFYRESKINIAPTNIITAATPNNNAMITLDNDKINVTAKGEINVSGTSSVNVTGDVVNVNGNSVNLGRDASVPAVDGNALVAVLTQLASAIETKYPVTPGSPNASTFSSILSTKVMLAK